MKDFTDYHQFAWSVVKPPQPPFITLLYRAPIFITIFLLAYFLYTQKITSEMDNDATTVTTIIISLIVIAFLGVLNYIFGQIDKHREPGLIKYIIDKQGIQIDHHQHSHRNHPPLRYPNEFTQKKALAALDHYLKQASTLPQG